MSKIRKLFPNELGADGLPLKSVRISFHPERRSYCGQPCDGLWMAEYPELFGYFGYGKTQEDALYALSIDCFPDPICQVIRVKSPDANVVRKRLKTLRDLGGVDAASEALKPNDRPLGVSPNELFSERKTLRLLREMCKEIGYSEDKISELTNLDDDMIDLMVMVRAGTGWFESPHHKHEIARRKIKEFLACEGAGTG